MLENFLEWGHKRIDEIPNDLKITAENKSIEIGKLEDRLKKFSEKMNFLSSCNSDMAEATEAKRKVLENGGIPSSP